MDGDEQDKRAIAMLRAERDRLMDQADALEPIASAERDEAPGGARHRRRTAMIYVDSLTRTIALATLARTGLTCWKGEI